MNNCEQVYTQTQTSQTSMLLLYIICFTLWFVFPVYTMAVLAALQNTLCMYLCKAHEWSQYRFSHKDFFKNILHIESPLTLQ